MATRKTENYKWLLVYTKAREEKRAKKNLENQGFEIFLPMIIYEKTNQSKSNALKTMFPSYLFIKINVERADWTKIESTRGVSHLVKFGQELAEVPKQVVVFLKTKVDENDICTQKITWREFQTGEKLVIKKGILVGKEAIFLSQQSRERVKLLMRLLNQQIIAELPASDIEKKEITETFKL